MKDAMVDHHAKSAALLRLARLAAEGLSEAHRTRPNLLSKEDRDESDRKIAGYFAELARVLDDLRQEHTSKVAEFSRMSDEPTIGKAAGFDPSHGSQLVPDRVQNVVPDGLRMVSRYGAPTGPQPGQVDPEFAKLVSLDE